MTPRGYALFDLDHTLLPFDTQALFCNFVLRRKGEGWRRIYLLWFLPCLPLAVLRIGPLRIGPLRFMKRLFSSYLWGMPEERLRGYAREFADLVARDLCYPEVVALLERDKEAGRITILNSASPDFYVEEIARALGFDHFRGTRLRVTDPMRWMPEIDGPNNKHGAKIDAMRELSPAGFNGEKGERLPDSRGYSDSSADVPLLTVCERGAMIHPSEKFAAIGAARGWDTLLPPRPYRGKWGGRLAGVMQAFGCYRLPSADPDSV